MLGALTVYVAHPNLRQGVSVSSRTPPPLDLFRNLATAILMTNKLSGACRDEEPSHGTHRVPVAAKNSLNSLEFPVPTESSKFITEKWLKYA
jgi:hypothetical protein